LSLVFRVVKRTSPKRKQAHVTLPKYLAEKYVSIELLDGSAHREIYARTFGASAHAYVDRSWIGKSVKVRLCD
jgi:hypothetical protein